MNFKIEFSCPFTEVEVGTCWHCQSFNYCANRKQMLASIGLNPEYTPTPLSWYANKSMIDNPHKYDDAARRQHLFHSDCGNKYFQ